jgi:hypothetical protein
LYTIIFRLLSVLIALIFNAWVLGELELEPERTGCTKSTPNPDIVGSGVRCSMYILLLFVFMSLLVATFHRQGSGTKELGSSVLISKHLLMAERRLLELTIYRSLCDEHELSYGQTEQFYSYGLPSSRANDRHAMCCVVCHSIIKRCTIISILRRVYPSWSDFCLGGRCVCQSCASRLILTRCE